MGPNRVRVLQLVRSLNAGGAEHVVVNLCNHLDPERFEVTIASLSDQIPIASKLLRPDQVAVRTLGRPACAGWAAAMASLLKVLPRLRALLKEGAFEVLHSHLWGLDSPMQYYGGIGRGMAQLATIHTTGLHYAAAGLKPRLIRSLESWHHRRARTQIVAVSEAVAQVCRTALRPAPERLQVIYNGVDVDQYRPGGAGDEVRDRIGCGRDDLLVIHVANLYVHKGHRFLLEAWRRVAAEVPTARLLLVGQGPLREELQALARESGLEASVKFLGRREDVPALLSAADVAVLPSLFEGFNMSVIEAMAAQLPVIGSDLPALREAIVPDHTGLVFAVGDSAALAEALVRVLAEPDLRRRMGRAGRARAIDRFSVAAQAREYERLYESLLSRPRT